MGTNKKKHEKRTVTPHVAAPAEPQACGVPDTAPPSSPPDATVAEAEPESTPPPEAIDPLPASRFRRLLPDLIKVGLAAAVIAVGAAIWYKPPLIQASFPLISYRFQGRTFTDATLYRPLAMPTRYYIQLPRQLGGRYTWFAVDRRREVAALTEEPNRRFLGQRAIKRSDPLGLDLEFRKLDHSEWQVHFFEDAIVFSNAILMVRMDVNQHNINSTN